ncbi:MAG: phosphoglycerate dehydrogenase [Lachnospiraceae bacterium]|nr:phosphoglycerate dehydrogenase [Lachnospiraceae bacterium]
MYQYHCLNPISPVGLELLNENYTKTEDMANAQAVLVRSAAMHDLEFSKELEAIARAGAGVNNIPLDRCAQEGIVVFNTPGANANGVKELVLAGMLLAARDVVGGIQWVKENGQEEAIAKMAEKQKKQYAGNELSGKKLGVIGLGAIGVKVANAATHLGMEVYGYDPYVSVKAAWELSRSIKHANSAEEIYANCDYITIHVPLMDSTKKMINEDALKQMKEGAVVLNFARDLLVDEEAMLTALKDKKVRKYVTDFPNPTVAGAEGVIVIPHLGASTEESEDNCARMAVEEVMDYLENGNIRNSVNYPNCDMGECHMPARVAVLHKNIKGIIGKYSAVMGDADINISDMTNKSRGDYAYSLLDLESPVTPEVVESLKAIPGVLKVRVIK